MKLNELLDEVKRKNGLTSDGELGRKLDVDKRRVSDYRQGIRTPDDITCLKIAEAIDKPLDTIIAIVNAATEKDEKRREVWENYMKRLGGIAASFATVFFALVISIVTPGNAQASNGKDFDTISASNVLYYVKSQLKSYVKAILCGISQKCLLRMNICRVCQMAT